MFRGTSFQRIDTNVRIYIPARILETIKESQEKAIVMTIEDRRIVCFTVEGWEKFKAKILASKNQPEFKAFNNVFLDHSHKCSIHKRERVTIPFKLKTLIGIKRDIVIAGVLSHFEIWSKESWQAASHKFRADLQAQEIKDEIAKLET